MSDDGQHANTSLAEWDDSEPTPEQQAKLQARYEKNVAEGKAPYEDVSINSWGELHWVMQELKRWSGDERVNLSGADLRDTDLSGAELYDANLSGANLRRAKLNQAVLNGAILSGAHFYGANLSGAELRDTDLSGADLYLADLSGAELVDANLSGTNFGGANLSEALLASANMSGANFSETNLSRADLSGAILSGANLYRANLSGANLSVARMDATTILYKAQLDTHTRLADVVWNGVPLTRLNWQDVMLLGDEQVARDVNDRRGEREDKATRLSLYANAVLANRQVATVLRSQGVNEHADRFAYRAQLCQRQVLRRQGIRGWPGYVGSLLLWLLAGYGYRIGRIFAAYALALATFAAIFFVIGIPNDTATSHLHYAADALLISLTAIHGRVFFEQFGFSPQAWVAAIESVIGIVIEGVFVAMLIQRFFAR